MKCTCPECGYEWEEDEGEEYEEDEESPKSKKGEDVGLAIFLDAMSAPKDKKKSKK